MEPLKRPNSTGSWMNLHVELEQLRGEVAGLREELASVQAELSRLRQSFAGLRATGARDFAGIIYDPPLIFRSFAGAKALCKRGPAAGDSVFVGVPTEKEVEVVVRSAGLTWSGVFQP